MSVYFRLLPYRRLFCLLLAASQLMPLPDANESAENHHPLKFIRVVPDFTQNPFTMK
jgi:hypothetical protein